MSRQAVTFGYALAMFSAVRRASLLSPEAEADMAPVESRRSVARLIGSAVAIGAIVVLGSLFWTALGALVSAWGSTVESIPNASADHTDHFLGLAPASFNPARPEPITPTPLPTEPPRAFVPVVLATEVVPLTPLPRLAPVPLPDPPVTATPKPTPRATPVVSVQATAQPAVAGLSTPEGTPATGDRNPWVLLPQPSPGARVTSGPLQLEARGRGDAPITGIRLELDGTSLPVSVEQRSDAIWRGFASAQVGSGHHSVKAVVTDAQGRSGSYGWTFDAGS